jgi:hypothetical protein
MFNHVFGRPHREKFLHDSHPNDPAYIDIPKDRLIKTIERMRENDRLDAIKTIYR